MNKIIYLDAAASAFKTESVIDTEAQFLRDYYANTGRGVCSRAVAADSMLAQSREFITKFIGAKSSSQVVFTSGTTDGMNRIVNIIRASRKFKTVAVSDIDHHSARMPWENLVRNGDATLVKIPLTENYNIDYENIPFADVLIITAMSNGLGVAQNVAEIILNARKKIQM